MVNVPPTHNPADCKCGGATGLGYRKDIVCPCCDGRCTFTLARDIPLDEGQLPSAWGSVKWRDTLL